MAVIIYCCVMFWDRSGQSVLKSSKWIVIPIDALSSNFEENSYLYGTWKLTVKVSSSLFAEHVITMHLP